MSTSNMTRRNALGLMVLGTTLATACKKAELSCNNTTGLLPAETLMRSMQEYTDKSPQPGKQCSVCQLFNKAAMPDQCGNCTVLKGPVSPNGYCKLWVQKQGA